MSDLSKDYFPQQRAINKGATPPPANADTMADVVRRKLDNKKAQRAEAARSAYGPRVLAMRLSNGELSDRLRLIALHPRRFSNEENIAVMEEAADRLDTRNVVQCVDFPGHQMWKFVVNGMTYWFTALDKALNFQQRVEALCSTSSAEQL